MLRFGEYLVNSFPSVAFYVGQDHTPSWRDGAGHECFLLGSQFCVFASGYNSSICSAFGFTSSVCSYDSFVYSAPRDIYPVFRTPRVIISLSLLHNAIYSLSIAHRKSWFLCLQCNLGFISSIYCIPCVTVPLRMAYHLGFHYGAWIGPAPLRIVCPT